jgi:mannose-6-phosphate isomerase-like protein (cupin superfamily)
MKSTEPVAAREAVILGPEQGRAFPMGRIAAVFKADGVQTQNRYAISEWWLDANTQGPGAHSHAEDDIFYVIEGTMSVLVGEQWTHADKGSFVLVPGGMVHDFENRSTERAAILNISVPGGFEKEMPGISDWYAVHPPGDSVARK